MCGRFTLTCNDPEILAQKLGIDPQLLRSNGYQPRYNIAPRQLHWIVRINQGKRELLPARWGLVNEWAADDSGATHKINARAETVAELPSYRSAFLSRRCIVPADGFFEWSGPKDKRVPHWFHRADQDLLLFAGLYEVWHPEPGLFESTFTIITTPANADCASVHDRMPAILEGKVSDQWLDCSEIPSDQHRALLVPAPNNVLVENRVSRRLNFVGNDDPDSIIREDSLFDWMKQGK